ncbi:MAG TPA: wax ester/triacylglycerol synthase family O-acyltransferase [Acidimicrobiia bacterium]|nr:wax ester/triacylglycerol synthase family O-acyltransferase [Acidimicrobiia bacterium]
MQRLDGMDASFVYLDTPATPMQVGMTCVFDPSTAPNGYSFRKVRRLVEDRLHLIPPFRRRLVEVPTHLHRPGWIDDPEFDLDEHLYRVRLPSPGGISELERFAADVASRPLDQQRPPWEMHVVEGLEGGMVGSVTKMHHAAVDGVSGAELTATLLDLEPEPEPAARPDTKWRPAAPPSPLSMAAGAVRELLRQPAEAASVLARTAQAAWRLVRHNRRPETAPPPGPFAAPRSAYNAPVTGARQVSLAQIELDDVRRIKDAAGVTINDVVLAVCAAALRGHLDDHGGVPGQPLVAAVPVSVRADEEGAMTSNHLSAMLVQLGTTIDEPMARLHAIAESSRAAKTQHQVLGPDTFSQLADVTPPAFIAALGALESRFNVLGRIPPLCNLIVSNFPGPPFPLYCAGARMVAAYPMGPLGLGTALNITVQSYLDTLWFGIVACPDVVPEPETLAAGIHDAVHELGKEHVLRRG